MAGYHTIQVSSRISAQGDFVELLANGDMLVRDGPHVYCGRPVAAADNAAACLPVRPEPRPDGEG